MAVKKLKQMKFSDAVSVNPIENVSISQTDKLIYGTLLQDAQSFEASNWNQPEINDMVDCKLHGKKGRMESLQTVILCCRTIGLY